MNNITEYFIKLQQLTNQNLEILQALNDSFFTKQTHLNVKMGDSNYAIPSFISLENKINNLQMNFDNLINAPATGEAFFNFDGNSRAIELRSFVNTPNSLKLQNVSKFGIDNVDIFKDFLTPQPYFNVDLSVLPNDITEVNIKKIIPKNSDLKNRFIELLNDNASTQYNYSELYKILLKYKEDIDYIEYDTIRKLPIRKNIGSGIYVIENIMDDYIDENLDEFITLKLRSNIEDPRCINNLTYRLFDETIYKQFSVGDTIITYDDSAKMEIVEIFKNTNTIKVKVLYGEYLNLLGNTSDTNLDEINDMCKLRFFADVNHNEYKYIHVPLEEDEYIYVAIAPLNSRMNIQSSWGTGLIINTFLLINENNDKENFINYYKDNVRNIGDALYEITASFSSPISELSKEEFNLIKKAPTIDANNLQVIQINSHLNNSPTIQNIRSLYSKKKGYESELKEVNKQILNIQSKLSSISFDDTTGIRSQYEDELSELNRQQNDIMTNISSIVSNISTVANDSVIPIENAKYHIRGFFDYEKYADENDEGEIIKGHIIGIEVQYRYINYANPQGTAHAITDKFLFSEWNNMESFVSKRYPIINNYDNYSFILPENNDNKNEPSFNQIDIPITQGETVGIRLRIIYDYGYPFITTASDWSEILNVEFPEEFLNNIEILDIIEENNNDIETNRFNTIINNLGINDHINDKLIDQNVTYYHKPENIASGFYTNERRVIPLSTKLAEISSAITSLQDEVLGTYVNSIDVFIANGNNQISLVPFETIYVPVESYSSFSSQNQDISVISDGQYEYDSATGIVSVVLNLYIKNPSSRTVKLFPLFPGARDVLIKNMKYSIFDKNNYTNSNADKGIWMYNISPDTGTDKWVQQGGNQYIAFRLNNPYDGTPYYTDVSKLNESTSPLSKNIYETKQTLLSGENYGTIIYPILKERYVLCTGADNINSYYELNSGDYVTVPIMFEYRVNDDNDEISKYISFDLRTSLYKDPINYTFKVTAKMNNSAQDKLLLTSRKYTDSIKYNTVITE